MDHFTGMVLVSRGDHILLSKGYGFADFDQRTPHSPETKYRIGSITKLFTATLIMRLRDERRLSLSDSICAYLDPCPQRWESITIHHLLSHTSGIAGIEVDPDEPTGTTPPWSQERIMSAFDGQPLEFAPGEEWRYSDWGYVLLGIVIEQVSGTSYEAMLRTKVFEPLGMDDTGYDRPDQHLPLRAIGYRLDGDSLIPAEYIDMAKPYAAGGLYSTIADLHKWDQALYSNLILPQESLDLMRTLVTKYYGYGWLVSDPMEPLDPLPPWAVPGQLQMGHPGQINGFSSDYLRFPAENLCVIVLSNKEGLGMVGPTLAAIVFGEDYSMPE